MSSKNIPLLIGFEVEARIPSIPIRKLPSKIQIACRRESSRTFYVYTPRQQYNEDTKCAKKYGDSYLEGRPPPSETPEEAAQQVLQALQDGRNLIAKELGRESIPELEVNNMIDPESESIDFVGTHTNISVTKNEMGADWRELVKCPINREWIAQEMLWNVPEFLLEHSQSARTVAYNMPLIEQFSNGNAWQKYIQKCLQWRIRGNVHALELLMADATLELKNLCNIGTWAIAEFRRTLLKLAEHGNQCPTNVQSNFPQWSERYRQAITSAQKRVLNSPS